MTSPVILPGQSVGILGSGQLGRMLAMAAKRMGYRVCVFSPEANSPAGQVSDLEMVASYEDDSALQRFAAEVDSVTLEFENIPASALQTLSSVAIPIHPSAEALHIAQHRLREKTYLKAHGFPVTSFESVCSLEELKQALTRLSCPAVLKTAGFGYDGKGQVKINTIADAETAWNGYETTAAIVEAFVPFETELSVVAARNPKGETACFGPIENRHQNHILDVSVFPAQVSTTIAEQARKLTLSLMETLDYVGVLCVEFFLTQDETLLINEIAPRPHNSGHLTIEAAFTSQFEQQLRAVCALPLGSFEATAPAAAMVNLLGDLWQAEPPDWAALLRAFPQAHLHLYGKAAAKPGRKMGHITLTAATVESVVELAEAIKTFLTQSVTAVSTA